jgi:hypothetical protein
MALHHGDTLSIDIHHSGKARSKVQGWSNGLETKATLHVKYHTLSYQTVDHSHAMPAETNGDLMMNPLGLFCAPHGKGLRARRASLSVGQTVAISLLYNPALLSFVIILIAGIS